MDFDIVEDSEFVGKIEGSLFIQFHINMFFYCSYFFMNDARNVGRC